jgi:hypothetical protein
MPWRHVAEWMYRSTFSWPQHYLEVSGQLHPRPRGNSLWYPLDRRPGGPQSWSRPFRDSNSNSSAIQPIASHYTDCAIPALFLFVHNVIWTQKYIIWFEVLTVVAMISSVLWDIMPCSPLKVTLCFGGSCHLHFQGWRVSPARNQYEAWSFGLNGVISQKIDLVI